MQVLHVQFYSICSKSRVRHFCIYKKRCVSAVFRPNNQIVRHEWRYRLKNAVWFYGVKPRALRGVVGLDGAG